MEKLKRGYYTDPKLIKLFSEEEWNDGFQSKDVVTDNNVCMILSTDRSHLGNRVHVSYGTRVENALRIPFKAEVPENTENKWVNYYLPGKIDKYLFVPVGEVNNESLSYIDGYWRHFYVCNIPDGVFQLKNGSFAIGEYGKYKPNLTFINSTPFLQWEDKKAGDFNLPHGSISVIKGDFFISKKGTKCFKVKNNGRHLIIRDGWGGAFESYRGGTLPDNQLYYRRASSNGGGTGYDYAVVPVDWVYGLSEEDL